MRRTFISFGLLCGVANQGKQASGYFATNTTVLFPNSKALYPYAFGPVKARVSAVPALTLEFSIANGTGYTAGAVTVTTDRSGRVVKLAKQKQACAINYTSTGSIQSVKCSTSSRRLSSEIVPGLVGEDEGKGSVLVSETNLGVSEGAELQEHRHLGSLPCPSCATLVYKTFSSNVRSICGTPFQRLVPSQYGWAKRAAAALCTIATKQRDPISVAYEACRCCIDNTDCTSGVCSDGLCLPRKLARGAPCPDFEDDDCDNGRCALGSFPTGKYICCPTDAYIVRLNNVTKTYHCAATLAAGALCNDDAMCKDGRSCARASYPSGPQSCCRNSGTAYSNVTKQRYCPGIQASGATCDNSNELCASGVCSQGRCLAQKLAKRQPCPDGEFADCLTNRCGRGSSPRGDYVCCDLDATFRNRSYYCTDQGVGSPCFANEFCTSGLCSGGVCAFRSSLPTEYPTHIDYLMPTDEPTLIPM